MPNSEDAGRISSRQQLSVGNVLLAGVFRQQILAEFPPIFSIGFLQLVFRGYEESGLRLPKTSCAPVPGSDKGLCANRIVFFSEQSAASLIDPWVLVGLALNNLNWDEAFSMK